MLPNYELIFANQAEKYDRFVAAEDFQGNLIQTLKRVSRLSREQVVADLGSGTGRMAFLLAPIVRHVYGIEPVGGMQRVAELKKQTLGVKNVDSLAGEHSNIPLPDNSIDLIIEGWSFLYTFLNSDSEWREVFQTIVQEMKRILRPHGAVALIETMGSFHIWNEVPIQTAELYNYFEKELCLKKVIVRTDYRFANLEEAVDLAGFFFGDEIGAEITQVGEPIVPEATAIWYGKL